MLTTPCVGTIGEPTLTTGVWIHGITGRMGKALVSAIAARAEQFAFVGGSSSKEIWHPGGAAVAYSRDGLQKSIGGSTLIVDFSSPAGNRELLAGLNFETRRAILIG